MLILTTMGTQVEQTAGAMVRRNTENREEKTKNEQI